MLEMHGSLVAPTESLIDGGCVVAELTPREQAVAQHYNTTIFDYETDRLPRQQTVEFAVTARYLERYIRANAVVADVGVGAGHYAELLARRGCRLHLVDIAQRLLDATTERLRDAGLGAQIVDATPASARHLEHIETASCDAVLLLGPLYHLPELTDREQALREATRILKERGILLAAGINRLAYLRDAFREHGGRGAELRAFHAGFLQDGTLDPTHAPPIAHAHLSTSDEFRSLCAGPFDQTAYVGVESFTGVWGSTLRALPPADVEAWLALIEQTGATPDGLGASDHFLFVGQKRG
jgi:ubiquinone/menaquinone biosynthesis C-methylase UbiE